MSRKLQTIYKHLSEYSEEEINEVLNNLTQAEKDLLTKRYGSDLHNPVTSSDWQPEDQKKFYGNLMPKIKRLLTKKAEEPSVEIVTPSLVLETQPSTIASTSPLLYMLRKGITNQEICQELNISTSELYAELLNLKNNGIRISRKYYSDGSIKYGAISTMHELNGYLSNNQDRTIITDTDENSLKLLLISDLHFGNKEERPDLIDRAFNYCAKNGINIILCGGDLIDGTFTQGTQVISDIYAQIEHFIQRYPYDKNILTFSVGGDHDMSAFTDRALDIIEVCNNYRHDVVIGGYNNMQVNLKNDKIHLYHHIPSGTMRQTNAPIILHGHSHKYSTEMKEGSLHITIPTLSNINAPLPSALELNIYFHQGYIANSVIKQVYFGLEDTILNEATFDTSNDHVIYRGFINNTEPFKAGSISLKRISQTARFNRRYGKEN